MSKIQFKKKLEQPTEQPQKYSLQYGDMLFEARRDIARARHMFAFLSKATSELIRANRKLSEEEICGLDWCMWTSNAALQQSDHLLEIELKALGRLDNE